MLSADTGYRGQRIGCGVGIPREFVGYRDKNLDTALGRVTLRRAYYYCAALRARDRAPRRRVRGDGRSVSPGLRRMVARAAAAAPFANAAELLAELAGSG